MNKQKADGGIEEWRDIFGYEGVYQVSNLGRVKRLVGYQAKTERIIKPRIKNSGYEFVSLQYKRAKRNFYVHRLVARAFIGECPRGIDVNHINGNKKDNHIGNLEYVTRVENMKHARKIGLHDNRGENQWQHKLTQENVWEIRMVSSLCLEDIGGRKTLALLMGVSERTIDDIVNGKTWREEYS